MDDFLLDEERFRATFLLRGYAGTGKTTLVSALVRVVEKFRYKVVLMAPTGRAAKVMATYSNRTAHTIHKKIYRQVADAYSGHLVFQRQKNYHTGTLFIVDEASMIGDESEAGGKGLLGDLIDYVFESETNKLLLVGDAAQLPPVGKLISAALDSTYLREHYGLAVLEKELTEVMRQAEQSGILLNATTLRKNVDPSAPPDAVQIQLTTKSFKDIYRMSSDKLEDGLRYAYGKYGKENTILICRSNKAATQYNRYIRQVIHGNENEIDAGDLLMIVRNNYFFLGEDAPAGFLANGDFVEVAKVKRTEELHGFRFATLVLRLLDYPEQPEFEAKIFLETLHSDAPALEREKNLQLYNRVANDYAGIRTKRDRNEAIRRDPYLNALQVKFAYALTCHKSQGGQWNAVFVDQGYLTQELINIEFVRWLYTAITRATNELFLVNFHPQFFGH
ncbi:MAG: AAA family ATPase [Ferruginibacter sp.]|nr:AAA family ATPase [Cytophagales bacterium]